MDFADPAPFKHYLD